MPGIFDRGPSAVLGELLGGALGINQQAPPLPQRNPARNQVPNEADTVHFMEKNGIPFTDSGIEQAIRMMSQQQGLTPSQDVIDESIFGPVGGAAPPGFTDPASIGFDPQLTVPQAREDLRIQNEVENDNRDPTIFDNAEVNQIEQDRGFTLAPQERANVQTTRDIAAGRPAGNPAQIDPNLSQGVPIQGILDFAEQNKIPITDGGIHEAARGFMGPAYDFDLIEASLGRSQEDAPDLR